MSQTAIAGSASLQGARASTLPQTGAVSVPPKSADPLVAKVTERIARLADENPLPRTEFAFRGSRQDLLCTATLRVNFECRTTSKTYAGNEHPEGSVCCTDEKAMAARLAALTRECLSEVGNGEEVAALIRKDPVSAFASLADGILVGQRIIRCHRHVACNACAATGQTRCFPCSGNGSIPCNCHYGKLPCRASGCRNGVEHYVENRWNPAARGGELTHLTRTCSTCNGSGYKETCHRCSGTQRAPCFICHKSGRVDCRSCGTKGWFVVAAQARVTGHPERTISFPQGTPASFASQVRALPIQEIPGKHADLQSCDIAVQGCAVEADYHCMIPHVVVSSAFGGAFQQCFEAVGTLARITAMPPFLDWMLSDLASEIGDAMDKGDMAGAVRLARSSRFTAAVLTKICTTGSFDAKALVDVYEGAISEDFVTEVVAKLSRAYDGIGRAVVRRTWLRLGLPVLAASAAVSYAQCTGTLGSYWQSAVVDPDNRNLIAVAVGLVPALLVAAYARRQARGAARTVLGSNVGRAPRQGRWLAAGLGLSLLASIAGQRVSVSNSGEQPTTGTVARAAPMSVAVAAVLSPSPIPKRLRPPLEAPVRGGSTLPQIQRGLQELGFYHGLVDGRMTHDTGSAVSRMLALVPRDQSWRLGGLGVAGMVQAILRDEMKLGHLPADAFITARLSNVTRGNLSRDDMSRLLGAASRAVARPGLEVTWSSADGQRGGRVIASGTSQGCASFDVEVRLRGAVESTGPEKFCEPLTTTRSQP